MSYRVLLFENEDNTRMSLKAFLRVFGYEVLDYCDPSLWPLGECDKCPCPEGSICAHFLITDVDMPHIGGLDFIESLKKRGCRITNMAAMSAGWENEDFRKAADLGCKTFDKPFWLKELKTWLEIRAKFIDPSLRLINLRLLTELLKKFNR
jgi:CheY-like chemotaxis protein